jgi:hypothetical protein
MNNFYKALDIIKQRLEKNTFVNTVLFANTQNKNLYKNNIFPIAHINVQPSPIINTQVSRFVFEIGVLEKRNYTDTFLGTKFEGNDNVIDNFNLTYNVINDLISYLNRNSFEDIEIIGFGNITPLALNDVELIDGWVVTITPNDQEDEDDNNGGNGNFFFLSAVPSFFLNDSNPNNFINVSILESETQDIIDIWLDNITYGVFQNNASAKIISPEIEVGKQIFTAILNQNNPLPDGKWLVNKTGASGLLGSGANFRYNPVRTSPIDPFNNPEFNPEAEGVRPFEFGLDTVEPVIINVQNGIITEIIDLPMTGFAYEG